MTPGQRIILYGDSNRVYDYDEFVFVGKGEIVTVPAGTFSCYHFQHIHRVQEPDFNSIGEIDLYFCPGVGLVWEQVIEGPPEAMKLSTDIQLTSYHVN